LTQLGHTTASQASSAFLLLNLEFSESAQQVTRPRDAWDLVKSLAEDAVLWELEKAVIKFAIVQIGSRQDNFLKRASPRGVTAAIQPLRLDVVSVTSRRTTSGRHVEPSV
jgi:hypothetical protein